MVSFVTGELGLRERKKLQTRRKITRVALDLVLERGFDNVSVAEIAARAQVSKMTVFNYFPTKEDILLGPPQEHVDEPAQVVRDRRPGESAVGALRRHFLDRLAAHDAITGLNDEPHVLRLRGLILGTPALFRHMLGYIERRQTFLAECLAQETGAEPGDLTSRLAAVQIVGVLDSLANHNTRLILDGRTATEAYPAAVRAAEHAFDLLEHGLGGYCVR
jgi:AcrR family transcriptional regulator